MQLNSDGSVLLGPLLDHIIEQGDGEYDFEGKVIKYYSEELESLVHAGKFPFSKEAVVEQGDMLPNKPLRIVVSANQNLT